ncbi:fluoroquinolone export ABC transporter permease subunit [Niallia circulans]|jgi:fluoroquinolone transport system permease protein|uniref:fluoroquinolone export ABC transporter permease subunit n=1 Tax=Niallia circulans TaxID=1397 RepID=UPI003525C4DA
MRVVELFQMDVKFQLRHGFYYAYALVTIFYIGLLLLIPEAYVQTASILIVFTDPSVLGFFFVGGIVLLERDQSIFSTLYVTPLKIHEYLISKVMSLTLLAAVTSIVLLVAIHQISFHVVPFLLAVILCSMFFTLLGINLAVRVKSVNVFLYTSPLFVIVFYLPLVDYIGIYDTPIFFILPTQAILLLMEGAFRGVSIGIYLYSVVILAVWIGLVYLWTYRSFQQFLKDKCFI